MRATKLSELDIVDIEDFITGLAVKANHVHKNKDPQILLLIKTQKLTHKT